MTDYPAPGKLALVIDDDVVARRWVRELLESRGHDVIYASNGLAGLELVQRLPASFSLVLVELDLRGLPGAAVVETLLMFRPDLPVLCMTGRRATARPAECLRKPIDPEELELVLRPAQGTPRDGWEWSADEATIAAVRARYAAGGDLVEAALQLSKGLRGEE